MKENLDKILNITNDVHIPIPIDEDETAEARLLKKPVLESRLIDDMEDMEHWEAVNKHVTLEISKERCVSGESSLLFKCKTNLKGWGVNGDLTVHNFNKVMEKAMMEDGDQLVNHMYNPGRIYAVPSAMRVIDREDWTDWNRLSAWIYPIAPGMKTITMRIQLHNDGEIKVPDKYEREGAHNITLKGDCWNHVVLEMPYLARDCVTGVSFDYDMVGHEPDAVDHLSFYIDKLELQKVDCDVYEGWIPKNDRLCYSNSGYQTGSEKIAIASDLKCKSFKLVETKTGKVVLEKEVLPIESNFGKLFVLDFSEIADQGDYMIIAGDLTSRVFTISDDVWESSIWKVLNFYLTLRCGFDVFGKHRACHGDLVLKHGDKSIIANGGWHDAGDLAQGLNNTVEATTALLDLAKTLKGKNDRLFKRVLEEAKWGLDFVLKTRFGDGYRLSYSSCSIWTDGIIGTNDDIITEAEYSVYTNFDAAYAEVLGSMMFADIDVDYSRYCLKIAKEDFEFGYQKWIEIENDKAFDGVRPMFSLGDMIDVQSGSIGALAASKLYQLTNEEKYRDIAFNYAKLIINCQQQEWTDWDVPMIGFYYQDRQKDLIWHHNHMSYAYLPDIALKELCDSFPDSPDYMNWYNALVLSGEYYKALSKYTAPYGIIPSGVYHEDEAKLGLKTFANHPMMEIEEGLEEEYREMVRKGFPLGKGYYVRVYPVWFSFRGNYNVMLSEGKSMSSISLLRNNYDLYKASQHQFEWIVGKNPTCQSTMYGEGYDYIQLYAVQPGQTVGALTVGMESHFDIDAPYWPQVVNATYKEVWVCPATKWTWGMADTFVPASVSGYLLISENESIVFKNKFTKKEYQALPHSKTGYFEINLPAGEYNVVYGGASREMTIISGGKYELNGALYSLKADVSKCGKKAKIAVKVCGIADLKVNLRAFNLKGLDENLEIKVTDGIGEATVEAEIIDEKAPIVGLVIPENDYQNRVEFTDI